MAQEKMDTSGGGSQVPVRTSVCLKEDDDDENEDNMLFFTNKGGFPLDNKTYERMWSRAAKIHPDSYRAVNKIRGDSNLPEVSIPIAPMSLPAAMPVSQKLEIIQKYISDLQYNHTGTQFYEIRKNRPLAGLMDCAKEMVKESLPIKCLEAVILALYLTNGIPGLDRMPLSFRTRFSGSTFCHVVLGVYYNGLYGALGMSRRADLMDKPITFKSLSSLVLNYKQAYSNYWHTMKRVAVGTPVPHHLYSYEAIGWRGLVLQLNKITTEEMCKSLDKYAREIRVQNKKYETLASVYTGVKSKPGQAPDLPTTIQKTPALKPIGSGRRKSHPRPRTKKSSKTKIAKSVEPKQSSSSEEEDDEEDQTIQSKEYQIRI